MAFITQMRLRARWSEGLLLEIRLLGRCSLLGNYEAVVHARA